ncbi:hypothetical protein AQI88_17905 [Streptomyces cellostaticus]|uniref:non-reducing end alpha-L-arabinofuranosidase n=1 Tax=Streptomyces cellostaticus TaxID=67285 RepID=A0A101NL11_9ACTN|nr:hypothetical protein AQI88_17905 [Streptomyces cellostaticus]GHI02054.1 hypothetical protein Scel_03750 [Streptomyces cellostaticus]
MPDVIKQNIGNGYRVDMWVICDSADCYLFSSDDQYLLIAEAIGSDGRRYFRSWTSGSLAGSLTPLAASESNPFTRASNVACPAAGSLRHRPPPTSRSSPLPRRFPGDNVNSAWNSLTSAHCPRTWPYRTASHTPASSSTSTQVA